jgi:hypothetical protein
MDELALLKVFDRANARKLGCWKYAKWLLLKACHVQRLPRQNEPSTIGGENEETNSYTRLFADYAAGVRTAEFDRQETRNNYDGTGKRNRNDHQNDDCRRRGCQLSAWQYTRCSGGQFE